MSELAVLTIAGDFLANYCAKLKYADFTNVLQDRSKYGDWSAVYAAMKPGADGIFGEEALYLQRVIAMAACYLVSENSHPVMPDTYEGVIVTLRAIWIVGKHSRRNELVHIGLDRMASEKLLDDMKTAFDGAEKRLDQELVGHPEQGRAWRGAMAFMRSIYWRPDGTPTKQGKYVLCPEGDLAASPSKKRSAESRANLSPNSKRRKTEEKRLACAELREEIGGRVDPAAMEDVAWKVAEAEYRALLDLSKRVKGSMPRAAGNDGPSTPRTPKPSSNVFDGAHDDDAEGDGESGYLDFIF